MSPAKISRSIMPIESIIIRPYQCPFQRQIQDEEEKRYPLIRPLTSPTHHIISHQPNYRDPFINCVVSNEKAEEDYERDELFGSSCLFSFWSCFC
ncbi:unnamed protein product [Blumeria hordei]|uniref:Uncharacterized protein n=1 Tax=Blumeria hordei TaxID=2867405 RepID=A0A383UXI8_BLUHO|nr:unnamed protein product [Blumeria hordei]